MMCKATPSKLAYPQKIDDWKVTFPFEMVQLVGDMLVFRGIICLQVQLGILSLFPLAKANTQDGHLCVFRSSVKVAVYALFLLYFHCISYVVPICIPEVKLVFFTEASSRS